MDKHHRNGSNVKGHYRNGAWISPHYRSETWVSELNTVAKPAYPKYINNSRPTYQHDHYGFDDFLYHFKTHSPYDEKGFNVYGIHIETKTRFNPDGHTKRDVLNVLFFSTILE